MKRKILYAAVLALLIAGCLAVYRAATFGWEQKEIIVQETGLYGGIGHVERLSKALTFPTISYHDREKMDWDVFGRFHEFIFESFPKTHATLSLEKINDYGLLYTWPGQEPALKPILLMAHQDVVPVLPDTEDAWAYPPFDGIVNGGYIWGRGSLDDKASMMGILETVEYLIDEGFIPKRTIYLAFGQDEEVGGEFGAMAIANHLKEQNVRLEVVLDEGGLILPGDMYGLDELIALVGISEKGYVSLELKARGEGGHSSVPPRHTAAGKLSRAITRLEENPFPANLTYVTAMMQTMGPELPFMTRFIFANQWLTGGLIDAQASKVRLNNATIRTTTAATMLSGSTKDNVLPITATAVVNFRVMPGEDRNTVRAMAIDIIDDPEIEVDFYGWTTDPAPISPTDSEAFKLLERSVHQAAGDLKIKVVPYITVGGTDSRYFNDLTPNIYRLLFNILDKNDIGSIHGTNERVSLENYQKIINFYYLFIKQAQEL